MFFESRNRTVEEYRKWGYNPIHLLGDWYLLRKYPKHIRCFQYNIVKIRRRDNNAD
jgi:hypothetical protein